MRTYERHGTRWTILDCHRAVSVRGWRWQGVVRGDEARGRRSHLGPTRVPRRATTTTTMAEAARADGDDDSGALDVDLFRLISSEQLQRLLDKTIGIGPKTLVLSPSLAGPLGLVTDVGMLKVSSTAGPGTYHS